MIAYVRSMKSWSAIAWAEPFEWSIPIWSNDNAKGSLKFAPDAPITKEHNGEWLAVDGNLFVIKDVKPSETEITVSVQDAINAFYRTHVMPSGYTTTGAFIKAILDINYKAQADAEYAMPYINVTNTDTTPLIQPTIKDDILFVMSDYMREVIKRGIKIEFSYNVLDVNITISTHGTSRKAIPMDDGHSQLVKKEFSSDITSKVTVIYNGTNNYWYLQADGSADWHSAPSPRIPGKWATIIVDEEWKAQGEVEKIFAKNTASLQVEFYSDKAFELNEPVIILDGKNQYESKISYIEINSDDNRYHYKAGDMSTTLIEKLRLLMNGGIQ